MTVNADQGLPAHFRLHKPDDAVERIRAVMTPEQFRRSGFMLYCIDDLLDVRSTPAMDPDGKITHIMLSYPMDVVRLIAKEPKGNIGERLIARGCIVNVKDDDKADPRLLVAWPLDQLHHMADVWIDGDEVVAPGVKDTAAIAGFGKKSNKMIMGTLEEV